MAGSKRKLLGKQAEEEAERYLRRRYRYRVLERNYSCRWGEVDLVCLDGNTLVFVEVRSSGFAGFGNPAGSVTPRKQKQIIKAVKSYLQKRRIRDVPMRFDVLGIEFHSPGNKTFTLFQDAFEVPQE